MMPQQLLLENVSPEVRARLGGEWERTIQLTFARFRRDDAGILIRQIASAYWADLPKSSNFEPITPTVIIDTAAAQSLMDQLWACGLRPTEGAGSAGAMAATQAHLKDMQNFANRLLEATLKGRTSNAS